jgi:uncharacterized protein YihD (DUF1040 family)
MMRDEERILRLVAALQLYWVDNPDLRLAQIVGNVAQQRGYGTDPYYMEDREIERFLREEGYLE